MSATITLHSWLEALIDRMADPDERAKVANAFGGMTLQMCVDGTGSWAQVTAEGVVIQRFGAPPSTERLQRVVTLPFSAILTCGELWQDSKQHIAKQGASA